MNELAVDNAGYKRVHHVAYACKDILAAERCFRALGFFRESGIVDDMLRKVRILFLSDKTGMRLELVEPLNDESPVTARLEQSKGAAHPYHICFEVSDLAEAREELLGEGYIPISPVAAAPAIGGKDVCFLFSREGGLVELVEG